MFTKYAFQQLVKRCIAEVIVEDAQKEPYDAETDTFAPGPRDRIEPSKSSKKKKKSTKKKSKTDEQMSALVKECAMEVFKEILMEETSVNLQYKNAIYGELEKMGFIRQGHTPRDYVEYYKYNFATIQVIVNPVANTVYFERYYDNEMLTDRNLQKQMELPEKTFSPHLVQGIVAFAKRLKDSIDKDEPILGGMDELPEGFDPLSQGPNPAVGDENPYPAWNAHMRQLEQESQGGMSIQHDYQGDIDKMRKMENNHFHGRYAQQAGAMDLSLDEVLELTPTGREDDWSRPIYVDKNGRVFVDIDMNPDDPNIHAVTDYGEPLSPVKNFKILPGEKIEKPNIKCPECGNPDPFHMHHGCYWCPKCGWKNYSGKSGEYHRMMPQNSDELSKDQQEAVNEFLANFGLGPNYKPVPQKLYECPQCKMHNAYYKEEHPDTDMNEMVLKCPDCGHSQF